MRHKDLAQVCYPRLNVNHKDLSNNCYQRTKVKHMDVQSKCYPTPKVKHQNLSSACLPRYKVSHKSLSTVCYKPAVRITHQDLSLKCYPKIIIKHKDMSGLSCTELRMKHADLNKVKIPCDPNMRDHTTAMEKIGKEIKFQFTRHRLYCKLENRYSGVTQGNVVETTKGLAVVEDYVVKKGTYYPIRIVVSTIQGLGRNEKGEAKLNYHKLSKEETKEIMIRELIKRQKFIWLVRMYPEERKNLESLKQLYSPGKDPNTPSDTPQPVPNTDSN